MQTILDINDKSNKRRKLEACSDTLQGHNYNCSENGENNKISISINTNNNLINELDKCKFIEQIGEFIINDYRLFYTKEQIILIINKFLQLQSNRGNNYETFYYS